MTTINTRVDSVSSILTCQSCMQLFDGKERFPKLMDCLHSICEQCVKTLKEQSEVPCPTCTVMRQIPPGGFPDNDLVLNYLYDLKLKDTAAFVSPHEIECGSCSSNGAVAYCVDWALNVCKACIDSHNLVNITRIPEVESHLDEADKQLTLRNKCQHTTSRKKRFLTMFRSTRKSQMAACSKCAAKTLRRACTSGTSLDVPENNEGQNKLLELLAEQCRKRSRSTNDLLPGLDELIVKADMDRMQREKYIDDKYHALVEKLHAKRETAKAEMQKLCDNRKQTLEDQKSKVRSYCAELEGASEFAEQLCMFSSPEECLDLQQQVTARMKELIERDDKEENFKEYPQQRSTVDPQQPLKKDSTEALSRIRDSISSFCYVQASLMESERNISRNL